MKLRSRTTFALTGATVALAAGAGGALAAGNTGGTESGTGGEPGFALNFTGPDPDGFLVATAGTRDGAETGIKSDGRGPEVAIGFAGNEDGGPPAAIASYLELSEGELRTELESGRSLAQIASAQGKSVSGLEDVIYADAKTHLEQAVAAGKLTADQEQAMLAELKAQLDDMVNSKGPQVTVKGVAVGPAGDAAASYLGLTPAELRQRLESGKTLAQIAADRGKSVEGLKATIVAGAKTEFDAAVAAGKITAVQEQEMLNELKSHIDGLVNSVGLVRTPWRR